MNDGIDYRMIGVTHGGGVYMATPPGAADAGYSGRFKVLPGGSFASGAVFTLNYDKANFISDSGSALSGRTIHREGAPLETFAAPFHGAQYKATLLSAQSFGHVYAAFQWYVDGKPVGTGVQLIGTVRANEPCSLLLTIPLDESQAVGTYSIHIYSGYTEMKNAESKKGDSIQTKGAPNSW